jgi:type I restriction enzyme M protein
MAKVNDPRSPAPFLPFAGDALISGSTSETAYAVAFRKLYYHLYSNSRSSRADRIIGDLSNLLLCKIAAETNGEASAIEAFLRGQGTANEILLPLLLREFPHLDRDFDRFSMEDDVLREALGELASLTFSSAPAHVLGEAFQALIGPRLRGDRGQFFTPRPVVRAIVKVLAPTRGLKVVDPACGTGGFLVEAYSFQMESGPANEVPDGSTIIGMDKDSDLCRLAQALLKIVVRRGGTVVRMNSLDLEGLSALPPDVSPLNADIVVTNPPFGSKIKITDRHILRQYSLGHRWTYSCGRWHQCLDVREAQDPQLLFLELCTRLLKPGGKMGIVLPEGVFGNSGLGYVWDYVRSQGGIVALIDCPRTTFQPSTDTKTNILFFEKRARTPGSTGMGEKIWMAVALQCGHDRRGRASRADGSPYPDDFQEIGGAFASREIAPIRWQLISKVDPYYLVPRYYDGAPRVALAEEASKLGAELISLGEMEKNRYIRIRKGDEVGAEVYGTGEIPFVRTSDIANYEVALDPTRGVSEDVYRQFAKQQNLAPLDILLVADGRYRIGRTAILHEDNYRCLVQSHIRIISVTNRSPIGAVGLLYLLNLPMVQQQIRNLVFVQSTLGSLGKRLYEIRIPLPKPTPIWQQTIGEFHSLIYGRANLLRKLRDFEHPGFEV